jgi:hypothetical protein
MMRTVKKRKSQRMNGVNVSAFHKTVGHSHHETAATSVAV